MTTKKDVNEISKANIHTLFRELWDLAASKEEEIAKQFYADYQRIQEEILKDPVLKSAERKWLRAGDRAGRIEKEQHAKIKKVRHRFYAYGLTEKVKQEIQALVEELHRE